MEPEFRNQEWNERQNQEPELMRKAGRQEKPEAGVGS
jgi:hypothetical protein